MENKEFKVGDMVRCVNSNTRELKNGKIYEVEKELDDAGCIKVKGLSFWYSKLFFEKEPVYGDEIFVKDIHGRCEKAVFIHKETDSDYLVAVGMTRKDFLEAAAIKAIFVNTIILIEPKTTLKLTLKEIAEKYGVDEVIINE